MSQSAAKINGGEIELFVCICKRLDGFTLALTQ